MMTSMTKVMERAYDKGWITTRDGNVSIFRHPHCMYVTPSGERKNVLRVEDLVKMKLDDKLELSIPEGMTPSIELDMHYNIHRDRGFKRGAIVHLHPTYCVAAMHRGIELSSLVDKFPELGRYTKVGNNVQQFDPGSDELATHTAIEMKYNDIVGQVGHGVTAYAGDPWSAYEHIERLEHICQIVLASKT